MRIKFIGSNATGRATVGGQINVMATDGATLSGSIVSRTDEGSFLADVYDDSPTDGAPWINSDLVLRTNDGPPNNPTISGIPYPGETLTSDQEAQWYLNGVAIPGETVFTYEVPFDAEVGDEYSQEGSNVIVIEDFFASLSPIINLSTPLKVGGDPAGYLDLIPAITNLGTASNPAQIASGSQPLCLPHDGENYLHLPGVTGNYASVPDSAALRPTGDMELIVHVTMADWTPSVVRIIGSSGAVGTATVNWYAYINTNGTIGFGKSTSSELRTYISSVATGVTDAQSKWIRIVFDQNNGSSQSVVRFYLSNDGVSWTQLGADITNANTGAGVADATPIKIGDRNAATGLEWRGKIQRFIIKNGINGTTVFDADFSQATHGATSFVATTGQTVTINRTGNNPATIVGRTMVRFDGVDDFMSGTFSPNLTGGRMFAIFNVLGAGGEVSARVFSALGVGQSSDLNATSLVWSFGSGGGLFSYYNSGSLFSHASGFSGRVLHEVGINGTSNYSRRNNIDPKSSATNTAGLNADRLLIGASSSSGANNPAIDMEYLLLVPATTTDAQTQRVREILNSRYELGLTL